MMSDRDNLIRAAAQVAAQVAIDAVQGKDAQLLVKLVAGVLTVRVLEKFEIDALATAVKP